MELRSQVKGEGFIVNWLSLNKNIEKKGKVDEFRDIGDVSFTFSVLCLLPRLQNLWTFRRKQELSFFLPRLIDMDK